MVVILPYRMELNTTRSRRHSQHHLVFFMLLWEYELSACLAILAYWWFYVIETNDRFITLHKYYRYWAMFSCLAFQNLIKIIQEVIECYIV